MRTLDKFRKWNDKAAGAVSIERFRLDSAIECMECGGQWPVFFRQVEVIESRAPHLLTTPLGTEPKLLNNRHGNAEAKMVAVFEQSWTERLEVSWKRASLRESSTSVGAKTSANGVGLNVGMQRRVQETFESISGVASETRRTRSETIEVTVPAHTEKQILAHWKQLWQEVECDLRFTDEDEGRIWSIPYRVAVSLVFDHEIRDL